MNKPKLNYLYKHEPVCLNGEPLLKNNLWNFVVGFDNLMHNTQCNNFVLPFDENKFTLVFDFNDMEKRTWSDVYNTYDKNDVFVEGKDVFSGKVVPSAMTYVWVRKTAMPDKMAALQRVYNEMNHYEKRYHKAQESYEKLKSEVMQHPELLHGMTLEEFLENLK